MFWRRKMHKVKKAIIMAAGFGSRLQPLTLTTPKPLIKVNGVRMIESVITGLEANGITEIYIVVGYLKEKFLFLKEKYSDITLIENPYYDVANNISSLYVARDVLNDDLIILDGDQIIENQEILQRNFCQSGYLCSYAKKTDEWLLTLDNDNQVIKCKRNGGLAGWRLYSISYWTKDDALRLRTQLIEEFIQNKVTDVYWDDIAMFLHPKDYNLCGIKIKETDLKEIDTYLELTKEDNHYEMKVSEYE